MLILYAYIGTGLINYFYGLLSSLKYQVLTISTNYFLLTDGFGILCCDIKLKFLRK